MGRLRVYPAKILTLIPDLDNASVGIHHPLFSQLA